jgi:ABC-type transporter Mla subunit MlaD
MFENMNTIVGDPKLKDQIRNVMSTLPDIFQEVKVTISDTRKTINSFRSVSTKAGKNLDSLQGFTDSLNDNGPEILSQVKSSIGNINGLVSRISKFTQSLSKLQNSEGTIGKLLNDTELYDSVLQTAENVRELSVRLDPMVSDLRMIARDPGSLGVRGALDRRPGKTGYKGSMIPRDNDSPLRR